MSRKAVIAMLSSHVERGALHIQRQHELIARLTASGVDTYLAESVLATFEDMQVQHQSHLNRMKTLENEAPGE